MNSIEDLKHIASLAKLKLEEEELKSFSQQFDAVLKHFENLSQIDTAGVVPLRLPSPLKQKLREDKNLEAESSSDCLSNAPEKSGNLFKVPPVV
jgi:aspartyl-tRNA(Asn)/glutamyl-tRNA(Gln) amidotransferase subunit C